MKAYPSQPAEKISIGSKDLSRFIHDFLKEELPDCSTNDWFIKSVNFANMIDKLIKELNSDE